MGLFDDLFGGGSPRKRHWTEDMEDYTEDYTEDRPNNHWTVNPDPDNTDRDDDWEEEQEKDFGDSWGDY